ncbi:MAG: DNA-3-methyladenine glycosylase, partial [Jatrophihabitans sp.]|uniref:DNA-3-methyladenine glycosylase n=1 Tax=Jatrophihabitans sp. TaxID=1932789 RepID=UPI003F810AA3
RRAPADGRDDAFPPARRAAPRSERDLARGPARLAQCLGLDAGTNGADLCTDTSAVRLERMPTRRTGVVAAGPRVGIVRAAERPWRFWLDGDPTVSRFKPGGRKRSAGHRENGIP